MTRILAMLLALGISIGGAYVSAGETSLPPEEQMVSAEDVNDVQTPDTEMKTEVTELPITIIRNSEEVAEPEEEMSIVTNEIPQEVTSLVPEEETVDVSLESPEEIVEETEPIEEEVVVLEEDIEESFEIPTTNNYGGELRKNEGIFIHEDGTLYRVKETRVVFSTAYIIDGCGKTPEDPAYGVTYSGFSTREYVEAGINPRVIAVDPSVIPIGTKVYIEVPESSRDMYISDDFGFASAEDTGGAIKGEKIDVLLLDYQSAIEWGVRDVVIYILEPIS